MIFVPSRIRRVILKAFVAFNWTSQVYLVVQTIFEWKWRVNWQNICFEIIGYLTLIKTSFSFTLEAKFDQNISFPSYLLAGHGEEISPILAEMFDQGKLLQVSCTNHLLSFFFLFLLGGRMIEREKSRLPLTKLSLKLVFLFGYNTIPFSYLLAEREREEKRGK